MCRIAGIISPNINADELLDKVTMMCRTLAHAGPDDEGIYQADGLVFGHRRLAIIDLTANGHQPMADVNKKAWITFNGEIYNYPEVKNELTTLGAIFTSDSDTEVIIQAYLHWGTSAFSKLRGMFAFALYDIGKALTYLVRDASGIKPLYYHINDDGISFSSEVRALKAAGIATEQDEAWKIRFLAYGHIPEPFTTLKDVFSLNKGHFLCWSHQGNSYKILPYSLSQMTTEAVTNPVKAQAYIRNAMDKTIKRQLLADAPIGVFLSGGIDSSLITLLAHQHKKEGLKTVSIYFDEQAYNEQAFQNIILEQISAQNYQHRVKQQDFETALPRVIADMDMPTTDGINSWFISKYAHASGLKAVLSGLGGDELFGGYPSFKRIKYLKYLKAIPSPVLNMIAKVSMGRLKRVSLLTHKHPLAEYFFLRGLFVPAEIAQILNIPETQVLQTLFAEPLNLGKLNDKEKASWFETNIYMQNQLLRDTDVMSMAHGLEVRVPFLDEDFINTVERISPAIRFDDLQNKKLLIDTYTDILPKAIWDRRKMGFSFPLQQWMQSHRQIGNPDLYHGAKSRQIIKRFKNNKVHWAKAFALYQLQLNKTVDDATTTLQKNILLLSLQTFSTTGGIQKMSRTLAHILQQIANKRDWKMRLLSGYDDDKDLDSHYLNPNKFKGYGKNRTRFALNAVVRGIRSDVVILTHINLSVIGWLIKIINPKCKVWLIAHGIEVWRPLGIFKRRLLSSCDRVICVSNFTKQKMISLHHIAADKCVVLNNSLDAIIKLPTDFVKPGHLLKRYNLSPKNKILFTLTRLASTEQYKGYEQVIKAVSQLKKKFPEIKNILSGKYDDKEIVRINELISLYEVQEQVIVTGFIDEQELQDHFLLADLFVLPSKKEGFGIVFIEALAHGLPLICGNEDGSLDAIRNGELGTAINPDSVDELVEAIAHHLNIPLNVADRKMLQDKCLQYFNIDSYTEALEKMLTE